MSNSYTKGLDRGIVYFSDSTEPWIGLVTIEEEFSERETRAVYIDGINARISIFSSVFEATVSAYSFPEHILDRPFNFVYRTLNDSEEEVYDLHIVYGCQATLSGTGTETLRQDFNPNWFQIKLATEARRNIFGTTPSEHYILRTSDMWITAMEHVEEVLYGTSTTDPYLPPIEDIIEILEMYVFLKITDNKDGTWEAEELNGATGIIEMISEDEFTIDWPSAIFVEEETYTVHSR